MTISGVIQIVASWKSLINGVAMPTDQKSASSGEQIYKVMKFEEALAAEVVGYSLIDLQGHLEMLGDGKEY